MNISVEPPSKGTTRILSLCLSTYMYLTPRTSRARILGMHHWLFYVDKLHVHILIIENGQRLLEACSFFDSCITDTFFAIKLQYRAFWRHSRWRHWHPLDLVIASRSFSWPVVTKEQTATETIRWLAQDQTGWASIPVLVGRKELFSKTYVISTKNILETAPITTVTVVYPFSVRKPFTRIVLREIVGGVCNTL